MIMTESREIDSIYEAAGKRIQELRTARRITQAAVAAEARLSRQSVANIEHGRQRFMFHTLLSIARALGVPPAELLPPPDEGIETTMNLDELKIGAAGRRLILSVLQPDRSS